MNFKEDKMIHTTKLQADRGASTFLTGHYQLQRSCCCTKTSANDSTRNTSISGNTHPDTCPFNQPAVTGAHPDA